MKHYKIQQCIIHGSSCSCEFGRILQFSVPELKDVQMLGIKRKLLKLLVIDEKTLLWHRSICSTPRTKADRLGVKVSRKTETARRRINEVYGVPYVLSA